MRKVQLAVLGGTFDHLHAGHEALLTTALRVGREVAIGVTTDRFVRAHPKPGARHIQSHRLRREHLRRWLARNFPGRKWRLTPLEDGLGRSIEPGVGALIVSSETVAGGRAVNRARRRMGRPTVPLVQVPLVLADDLRPVSSRRIRAGEISPDGRRLALIRVSLRGEDPKARHAAERGIRRVFPHVRFICLDSAARGRVRRSPSDSTEAIDLAISVSQAHRGGWTLRVSSSNVRLLPCHVPGARMVDLERGVAHLLRPRV